jgi:type I restriction-modification system DNA methylase subunit
MGTSAPKPVVDVVERFSRDRKVFQSLGPPIRHSDFDIRTSPHELSVLPADILGQVYEQFLGKVIRLTAGHQAKVEEKPEVRKAGGVYYTPTYIVDCIVKNTVGKLVEGKAPAEVSKSFTHEAAAYASFA